LLFPNGSTKQTRWMTAAQKLLDNGQIEKW
jgi:hypothetical protein